LGFIFPIEHLNTTESDTHDFVRMSGLGGVWLNLVSFPTRVL